MYTPIVIKIGGSSNSRRRSDETDDAPQLSSPVPLTPSASPTMPTLSVNTPEEDETAQVIVEPRKPINANGMFGRYERNSIDNYGAQSSSIPLKPEPSTSPLNSPAISSSNVKTWTQPLATPAKSFPNIELAVPSGDAKVKLSQHARPTIAPATFGQQIASSKPSHISTSSLSVSELLNVDAVNQAPADDGPKAADIANSRQESLVCHYEHFLCTRPVISGELYCMVHLKKRPKNTLHCNYINSESDDDCDQPLLNEMHNSCGLCPRHSTLAEARRSTYNKKLESRRTLPRILGLEPSKDTCQWRSSPDEQGMEPDMTFPPIACGWPNESSFDLSDQPSEHIRFDPLMYSGCLTSVQLIAIVRDKYDELLECLVRHCTALHHLIKLKKKIAKSHKRAPDDFEPHDPEIAENVELFRHYMKPRHENAFIYEMKRRKRARKALDSDPKTKCAYAKEELLCDQRALPSSEFCADHVLCDKRQALFVKCENSECDKPRKIWDKYCADHAVVSVADRISLAKSNSVKRPVAEFDEDEESDDPNRRRSVRLRKRLRKHVKLNKDGSYIYEYSPKSINELDRDSVAFTPTSLAPSHGSRWNRDSIHSTGDSVVPEICGNSDQSMTAELALLDHQYGGASFSATAKTDLDTTEETSADQWDS